MKKGTPMTSANPPLSDVLELLGRTREIAIGYFYSRPGVLGTEDKGGVAGFDPVTLADREIEAVVREGISRRWPADRIVGEEEGESGRADAERSWFVDPIDGTKAFFSGMTGWGTLIGAVENGRAVAGIMDQPVLGETYIGFDGSSEVVRRGLVVDAGVPEREPLAVSTCEELGEAVCYSTHPSMFDGGEWNFGRLGEAVRLQRFGGDCYAYCQLAAGRVDLVVESQLGAHDIVALIPIIEGAGGVIEGPDGSSPIAGGTVVAAATPELARQAWAALRG